MPRRLPDITDPNFDIRSVQDENGIDLTLVDYMLSLTPTQRLREIEQGMQTSLLLQEASKKIYGAISTDPPEAE